MAYLFEKLLNRSVLTIFWLAILFCSTFADAQNTSENIPDPITAALIHAKLPEESISFSVIRINPKSKLNRSIAWQENQAMNPASTMKLVTTLGALDILGPQYRWHTNVYTNGVISQGVLQGNLYLQGSGDPKFIPEELLKITENLRQQGIHTIDGDLIFDKSAYSSDVKLSAPNDQESQRSYNVTPDPLLYAFQTLSFNVEVKNGVAKISYTPHLANLNIVNKLKPVNGPCKDWWQTTKKSMTNKNGQWYAQFSGFVSKKCEEMHWNVVSIGPEEFLSQGIIASWEEAGGHWKKLPITELGKVPASAKILVSHQGITLGEAVIDVNKFSNNVMARQIFLSLSLEKNGKPANTNDSEKIIKEWLKKNRLNMPNLVLQNGSGLSDIERISSKEMSSLLEYSLRSKNTDIFLNSLPVAGVDGTMKHRLIESLKQIFVTNANASSSTFTPDNSLPLTLQKTGAYIKTGTLSNVRAISGFVVSRTGQVYAVSSFINHINAAKGGLAVQDALLNWLLEDGPDKS